VDMIANLAGKESEQEEDMKTARERVREIEMREREMKTLLELQLEEAKQREAALKKTEVKEREKRGALEDELKLASASILRLERDREELRARSQKAEDLAREKAIALYGELKREQDAVKALKVDIKVETEKAAAVVAQEQERASELVQKLAVARECVLQSERREQEAVATLEVCASVNAQFRVLTHTRVNQHTHTHTYDGRAFCNILINTRKGTSACEQSNKTRLRTILIHVRDVCKFVRPLEFRSRGSSKGRCRDGGKGSESWRSKCRRSSSRGEYWKSLLTEKGCVQSREMIFAFGRECLSARTHARTHARTRWH